MPTYRHYMGSFWNHQVGRKYTLWQCGDYHYEIDIYSPAKGWIEHQFDLQNTPAEEAIDLCEKMSKTGGFSLRV